LSRKSGSNPFYPLIALTGVVFVITTLAYVVAWVRLLQPANSTADELGPLLQFFNDRGDRLMVWEVVLLAILAILAMGLDRWRGGPEPDRATDSPSDGPQGRAP
jgi:hypothetical protein